ncbi:hypothetical protein DL89DRAFT_111151 [Linderina pennispora]|uniref:Essential protein Yae1 N-terminal domain-containing protein n=1 Tax=Linderina pennispora TaxID=61395 RepID=A0A1Y1WFV9_9FUNG|nr:uncharacterized protein DL89DRAFT_111151 [Linderina pennispora]ORX72285.1 hypothetical protein DL89DRAFT_111151 [Linderina pennispora]
MSESTYNPDFLERTVDIEDEFEDIGYEEGVLDGKKAGAREGCEMGCEYGLNIGRDDRILHWLGRGVAKRRRNPARACVGADAQTAGDDSEAAGGNPKEKRRECKFPRGTEEGGAQVQGGVGDARHEYGSRSCQATRCRTSSGA